MRGYFLALTLSMCGCANAAPNSLDPQGSRPSAVAQSSPSAARSAPALALTSASIAPPAATEAPAAKVDVASYPWLGDRSCAAQTVAEPLSARVAPPAGMSRASVEKGSFGAWLRGLPLRPKGPVVDYKGRVVLEADDPRLEAVVAIDEGSADLQQCADSIMRLHAEWLWSTGDRTMSYRAASGTAMPFSRWLGGERVVQEGRDIEWARRAAPSDPSDHSALRRFLDAVFGWANTGALARDAAKVALAELRPGDFFVLAGSPGHAVLVLDVASNSGGERAALLGQGYMPAQSFHVLRASAGSAWFAIDPAAGGVQTPFWPAPFPWSSLRRLD